MQSYWGVSVGGGFVWKPTLTVTYEDKIANILVEEKWSSNTENVCCIALFSIVLCN